MDSFHSLNSRKETNFDRVRKLDSRMDQFIALIMRNKLNKNRKLNYFLICGYYRQGYSFTVCS